MHALAFTKDHENIICMIKIDLDTYTCSYKVSGLSVFILYEFFNRVILLFINIIIIISRTKNTMILIL